MLGGLLSAAAAFRRLCVETASEISGYAPIATAAFRRLCVETAYELADGELLFAAAFRRLCVETHNAFQSLKLV